MPIYEYRCEKGHTFEVIQRMSDDPISSCEVCGATVQRVFHPVAVHFKGSGFYNTDYGKQKRAGGGGSEDGAGGSKDTKSDSGSSSDGAGPDKKKEKKKEAPAGKASSSSD